MNKLCVTMIFIILLITGQTLLAGSTPVQSLTVSEKEITEQNKNLNYEITAKYPQVENYENENVEKKINDDIYSFVNKDISGFQEDVRDLYYEDSLGNYYDLSYQVLNKKGHILSICFLSETYMGGAHGSHYFSSLNYNLDDGEKIELSDLFRDGADYLQVISDYCIEDLKKQSEDNGYEPDVEWIKRGTAPEEENFICFNLTDTSLVIMFNVYQVGCYAEGPKEVIIPYSELKDILTPHCSGLSENTEHSLNFTDKIIEKENKKPDYSVKAVYPQLTGYEDINAEDKFNKTLSLLVDEELKSFYKGVEDYASNTDAPPVPMYYDRSYSVINENPLTVSLLFYLEVYEGGAHPSHNYSSLNYNLETGKEIKLSDLFYSDSDYLKVISDYCIKELHKDSGNNDGWIEEGAGPKIENFTCFNIASEGLIITFNEYQVAPYVEGAKKVTVPYSELQDVLI